MQFALRSVDILLLRFVLFFLQLDITGAYMLLIAMSIVESLIIIVSDALMNCSWRNIIALFEIMIMQMIVMPYVVIIFSSSVMRLFVLFWRAGAVFIWGSALKILPRRQRGWSTICFVGRILILSL